MTADRCAWTYHGKPGPRCCLPAGHTGDHAYRCAGPSCPGFSLPASVARHPATCLEAKVEPGRTTVEPDPRTIGICARVDESDFDSVPAFPCTVAPDLNCPPSCSGGCAHAEGGSDATP